jgi:Zn-dependent peptidase ImmA (M78 family)
MNYDQLELNFKPNWIHRYQILDALSELEESLEKQISDEKLSINQGQIHKHDKLAACKNLANSHLLYNNISGNPYANIDSECEEELEKQSRKVQIHFDDKLLVIGSSLKNQKKLSDKQIEKAVIEIQKLLWHNRHDLGGFSINESPVRVLNPDIALKALGYTIHRLPTLGTFTQQGYAYDVAGLIDQQSRVVKISQQFSVETQNFTAAHELAHAFLHEHPVMHRDRPPNGSCSNKLKDYKEWQADRFATFYLMPAKLVKSYFLQIFQTTIFEVCKKTANALKFVDEEALITHCRQPDSLARLLASTTYYNSKPVRSMSEIFNVSNEAMAIRLKELQLFRYP